MFPSFQHTKFDLTGRTALVTGGAGLLGKNHAQALLQAGAAVILADIDEGALSDAVAWLQSALPGCEVTPCLLDVSSQEAVASASQKLARDGHEVRILVNNAAVDAKVSAAMVDFEESRFETFSPDRWYREVAVGLTGAYLCSQVFGTLMAEQHGGGVILNIASDLSVLSPDQRLYRREGLAAEMQPVKPVTYSVIKAGLVGLTRYLSTYWALQNVRCNALSPGGVFTDQSEEFVSRITELVPLGRMAEVDEYHSAIQFLCSDASSYMNGQNIVMDGGRSVW